MLAFLLLAPLTFAQPRTTFEGHPAVTLGNDKMELTIILQGGSFANLTLRDDPEKLSPLWNPIRMAREAGERQRGGSAMGHFVCVDGFGPVSPEERAAGMPGHGEAHTVPWDIKLSSKEGPTSTIAFAAKLPIVQEVLTRTMRMIDGENVVYVHSQLENLMGFDRPVCWAEHATIGSPFLEPAVTVVDTSAHRSQTRPWDPKPGPMPYRLANQKDFTWPMAPLAKGGKVDLRAAPDPPNSLDHTTSLMDTDRDLVFVTALHPVKRLILGYVFKHEEYPWLQTWEYYAPNRKMARGMEFSTQPYDVPRREVIQTNSMFGAPVYRWLPAKSKIESRFVMFYAHAPEGFKKVDDVRLENGRIVITDKKAGKQIVLTASAGI